MSKEIKRRGDHSKCPACGWRIDPEAYHCPKCSIYFCYKCRGRVVKGDPQYQCANQSCEYYGKLLCAACTIIIEEKKEVEELRVTDDGSQSVLIIASILAGVTPLFVYNAPIIGGWPSTVLEFVVFFCAAFFVFGMTCAIGKSQKWFKKENYTSAIRMAQHRCCIQCRHPVKDMP